MNHDGWFFTWQNLAANVGAFIITGLMLFLIGSASTAPAADITVFTDNVPVYSLEGKLWKVKVSRVEMAMGAKPYVCFQYNTKQPLATCWYTFPDGITVAVVKRLVGEYVT